METAETAYALALAYANVQNDDAESMSTPDTVLLLPVLTTMPYEERHNLQFTAVFFVFLLIACCQKLGTWLCLKNSSRQFDQFFP